MLSEEDREELDRRADAECAQAWKRATLGIPFEAIILYGVIALVLINALQELL